MLLKRSFVILSTLMCTFLGTITILFRYGCLQSTYRHIQVSMCEGTERPNPSYAFKNDTSWQLLTYSAEKELTVFIYNVYLDARNDHETVLRTFVVTEGYFYREVFCYLWYSDLTYPLVVSAKIEKIEVSRYTIDGVHYSQYMVVCSLWSTGNSIPHHVSLGLDKCGPVSAYVPITQPYTAISRYNSQAKSITIGVCMAPQYGKVSDSDAPFFVQWMESLLLFGVSHVHMFNFTLRDKGDSMFISKAIDYYRSTGSLSFESISLPFETKAPPRGHIEYNAAETLRMIASNDCLYRNMGIYDYILHIDRDEVIVPNSFHTYQEYLTSLGRTQSLSEYESIVVRSAFFYKHFQPYPTDIPDYFPLNRLSYRTPVEESNPGYAGFIKSFNNPKKCINMWSHRCNNGKRKHFVTNESDILVHHYRNSCRMKSRCAQEWESRVLDTTLNDKYGKVLQERTLDVLRKIQYPTS